MNNLFERRRENAQAAPGVHRKPAFSSLTFVRFSIKEQMFFAKRLSFLVRAGVPLIECLHLMRSQTRGKARIRVYDSLIEDIAGGQYLATSLGRHRRLFGDFAVNLIRVGESSGILSQNLNYLADELQKKHTLRRKIVSALVYPAFITVATLGVTSVLTGYIFPKLMPIFSSLNVDLPPTTRALIAVSAYLRNWGLLTVFLAIVFAALFLFVRSRSEGLRYWSDAALLRIPFVGTITRAYNLTNFTRTLGLLLRSGIVLTEAVAITGETTMNRVYRAACTDVAAAIIKGEPVSRPLERRRDVFPDLLSQMIAIGERTGYLSQTLVYLSEMYEGDVDDLTKSLSSTIEPVLMIVMGILVGLIAVSVITPIYEITQHLQPK